MTRGLYRIQGDLGGLHHATWTLLDDPASVGIRARFTPGHHRGDLAASILLAAGRMLTVVAPVTIHVGPAGDEVSLAAGLLPGDLPTSAALTQALVLDGPSEAYVTISAARGPALLDSADVTGVLILRDIDQPIGFANASRLARTRRDLFSSSSSGTWDGGTPMHARFVLRPDPPPDAHLITSNDPRFSAFFTSPGDLRSLVDTAPVEEWNQIELLLDEVRGTRDDLSGLTLEEEAATVIAAMLGPKMLQWVQPMGRRFGLGGDRLDTLDQVGRSVGVTRERVRQIQTRLRLPQQPLMAPAADAAVRLLEHLLPAFPTEIAEAFRAAGLSDVDSWHADPLASALALTGREVPLEETNGLVGHRGSLGSTARILSTAKAASNRSGAAHPLDVLVALDQDGINEDLSLIEVVLHGSPDLHWMPGGSFWANHAPRRNRLVNTSHRILSVIQPQSLEDMHGGVERNFRWRASTGSGRFADIRVPDLDVLAAFFESHPEFSISNEGTVMATAPIDINELGPEKLAMVGVLAAQPAGVMGRNALMAACAEAGMKTSTAQVFLTYGECFKTYGPNVWGLRGLSVTQHVIAEAQQEARAARRSFDKTSVNGLTPSGRPWFAARITPTILYSGVMTSSWAPETVAESSLDILDLLDGEPTGTLRFSGPFNYGYNVILRKHNAKVGDVVRILADPAEGVAHVEIGADELLSEPFDL